LDVYAGAIPHAELEPAITMNRSFLIILVPAVMVALGYFFVLRWLG
jgi:hypothetical protein